MNELIGNNISILRKEHGLTQEQLANALGISYQAVSKWETGNACPDISMLPLLADLFSVSVDQIIGRLPLILTKEEQAESANSSDPHFDQRDDLPWPDDDTFYMVLFHGHTLVDSKAEELHEKQTRFLFRYEGPAQNIQSDFAVSVDGDVEGSVKAGTSVSCGDVGGDVISGGELNCGDVGGGVRANGSVNCGDVARGLEAGGNVNCGDVGGAVNAGGSVDCEDVDGSVYAGGRVDCEDVGGRVAAGGVPHRQKKHGNSDDLDRELDDLDRELDDLDRELDERIDRKAEDSIRFSMNMSDLGEGLGQKISAAMQKAMDFGKRFRERNAESGDEIEDE